MIDSQNKNHRIILIIFGMTIVPFLIAVLLNVLHLTPAPKIYGKLVAPAVPTEAVDFQGFDDFSTNNLNELAGHWLFLTVVPNNACNATCLESVLKVKQLRLMLNKDFSRTRRAVLIYNPASETQTQQWWLKDALLSRLQQTKTADDNALYSRLLGEDSPLDDALATRLIGKDNREAALQSDLIKLKPSDGLRNKLNTILNGAPQDGILLLLDPLGNIMLRYESGFDPYKVKSDLSLLLRASQIG